MAQINTTVNLKQVNQKKTFWYVFAFVVIAVIGLFYVKWWPYYHKTILAANTGSIGTSVLGDLDTIEPSFQSAIDYALIYFKAVWKATVLGVVLGSLIQVLLPTQWLLKLLGKTSFGSTARAGMASIPGMMCSCCAAPLAVGLRKKNVSIGAALAFWIGNPMLNPATLLFMAFVLSWKFTLIRLVVGIILTFGVSYLANKFVKNTEQIQVDALITEEESTQSSFLVRWGKSLGSMLLTVVPTYIIAVLLLGAVRVWLFPHISEAASNSMVAIIIYAVAGMLFVIPTAAEIPIAQTFMSMGLGSGPATALLITLPAISLPSIIMVAKSFPKRVIIFVITAVVVLGIVSGIIGSLLM